MEIRHLKCFAALAHDLHFGRAAQRLCVTQPALSFSIRQFEESLGMRLFERSSRHVRLTSAGHALLVNAEELLLQINKTSDFAKALAGGLAGHLEVGFGGTMLYRGLAEMVAGFWSTYPMIDLKLREMSSLEQLELLAAGELDAGFINDCAAPTRFEGIAICQEHFVACLPHSHRLARRKSIELAELAEEPFVMFTRAMSRPYYDYIIGLCADAGFRPRTRLEAAQLTSVAGFVAHQAGVAILPEAISRVGTPGVKFIRLKQSVAVPCAFFVWDAHRTPPGIEAFVACVKRAWPGVRQAG